MRLRPAIASLWLASLLFICPASAQEDPLWTEVRSPHFVVFSEEGEQRARWVLEQFEQFRDAFQRALPQARVNTGKPLTVLVFKNEAGFRVVVPDYWDREGGYRPAGFFQGSPEKHYVAMRTDDPSISPYRLIYHEYAHSLMSLNYQVLPAWLNEGLAEFYALAALRNRTVMGSNDPLLLRLLAREPLLPLETLLAADYSSPLITERNRTTLFYAQSWALVSLLFSEHKTSEKDFALDYGRHAKQGAGPIEAARLAFGDLSQLESRLARYIQRGDYFRLTLPLATRVDTSAFPARAVPLAEVTALKGDLLLYRGRHAEARALIEEALRRDPNNALAHESMGYLFLNRGNLEEADRWLSRAVQLDSRSYLALYFSALLSVRNYLGGEPHQAAEAALSRVLEMNPDFAPAHATLAALYNYRVDVPQKALWHAQRAVELEPGSAAFRVSLGNVLLRQDRAEEAIAEFQMALSGTAQPLERRNIQALLTDAERYKQARTAQGWLRPPTEPSPARPATPGQSRAKTEIELPPGVRMHTYQDGPLKLTFVSSSITGVPEVLCAGKSLELVFPQPNGKLRLLAPDRTNIWFQGITALQSTSNEDCKPLAGKRLKVTFQVADDSVYAGQIQFVEIVNP